MVKSFCSFNNELSSIWELTYLHLFLSYNSAYQNDDIVAFEKIVSTNRTIIMQDPFIREHIEDLLKNVRTNLLIKLIKPYTRINISYISAELNVEAEEVENLLVSCILDKWVFVVWNRSQLNKMRQLFL